MVRPKPADNNERDAADLVAPVVGGTPELRDTRDKPGRYDYNIVLPNDSIIALEVTRHTSQADCEFWGILRQEKKQNWRFPSLRNDYSLMINTPAERVGVGKRMPDPLERLRREIPTLLEELEQKEPGTGPHIHISARSGFSPRREAAWPRYHSRLSPRYSRIQRRRNGEYRPPVSTDHGGR